LTRTSLEGFSPDTQGWIEADIRKLAFPNCRRETMIRSVILPNRQKDD